MDLIKEINEKYQALEAEIDKKLEKVDAEEQKLERQYEKVSENLALSQSLKVLSYEEALQRNINTLKSLEIAKARLRSRSTYSPVEKVLQRAYENYVKELESLESERPKKITYDGNMQTADENEMTEEEDLYKLVMQNVWEANAKENQPIENRRN